MNRGAQNATSHGDQGNSEQNAAASCNVATIESIKLVAESIGISNLNEDACKEIITDLTFTIKSILLDAQKFARKSKRKKITPSDVDYSLKVRLMEPIYGFYSNEPVPFRSTTSTGSNASGRYIYYVEDQIVDLNEIISVNNASVKLPNDFIINAHWLAIEGVQPSVPENPQLVSIETQKKDLIEGSSSQKASKEKADENQRQKNMNGESLVKMKSLIPHDLSIEQQIYFKEITESCVGSDENKRTEALNSLSLDPGLHQLLPRFILFISEGVRLNILQTNMAILIYLMRMAKALIENKSIYLEKYLHELLPSVFSCLLSKQLCARPEKDNHFALREYCARLIGQILKTYGATLTFLQSRIIKVYLNSIESEKTTFSTLFGTIVGLSELGDEICESILFPLIKPLGERVVQILDSSSSTNQEKLPAEKVKEEIIRIVSNILKTKAPLSDDEFDYLTSKFGAYFGELVHSKLMKLRNQQKTPIFVHSATTSSQLNKTMNPRSVQPVHHQIITQTITPKPILPSSGTSIVNQAPMTPTLPLSSAKIEPTANESTSLDKTGTPPAPSSAAVAAPPPPSLPPPAADANNEQTSGEKHSLLAEHETKLELTTGSAEINNDSMKSVSNSINTSHDSLEAVNVNNNQQNSAPLSVKTLNSDQQDDWFM